MFFGIINFLTQSNHFVWAIAFAWNIAVARQPKLNVFHGLKPLQGLQPVQDGRFSTLSHFSDILSFFEQLFLHTKNLLSL